MDILLTGSTGFLGSYVKDFLAEEGNNITEVLRSKTKDFNSKTCYVGDLSKGLINLGEDNFAAVVHCAGLAHSRPTTALEKQKFFTSNLSISKNLILSLEKLSIKPKFFVFISSVAVYGLSSGDNIDENTPLCSEEPYGKSKIESEKLIRDWCLKNAVTCTILRPSLIAGEDAPGNLRDLLKGLRTGRYFLINKGKARRSIVLASDIAKLIPLIWKRGGVYNVTDGYDCTFFNLTSAFKKHYGIRQSVQNMPFFLAKTLANIGDLLQIFFKRELPFNTNRLEKMTQNLTFSSDSIRETCNWKPEKVVEYYFNT